MAYVVDALEELGISEFVLRGEPTTEAEFNRMFRKVTGADANGSAIESGDTSDFGVTWTQVSAKLTELNNDEPLKLLREERNRRLADTDWWGASDLTMTTAQENYRQALRDLTNHYTDLDTVVWPTKP